MGQSNINLAALIGSRICHDLISPIGAINNGLELLGMSGGNSSPEMDLIQESVGNASARIRATQATLGSPIRRPVVKVLAMPARGSGSFGPRLARQESR